MKKILWVGDAVVSSGFAMATHAVCDHLQATGEWEVHVLGVNYYGDPHPYPYTIYPPLNPLEHGHDQFGISRLPHLIHEIEPDIVVIMTDPWHIPNYMAQIKHKFEDDFPLPPIVGWLAVDGKNQKGTALNELDHIVTWTQFAADELELAGYMNTEIEVVPLGVDTKLYRPCPKQESRMAILGPETMEKMGENPFIVGAVGRNQPRKRLDLTIQYFADWYHGFRGEGHTTPNAYLYLHVGPTGDTGVDLKSVSKYFGVYERVLINTPPIGMGIDPRLMPFAYSMLDVYVTTTQGEGWGLPCLEAMACGVPCIVPSWSALGEWTAEAAVHVPCLDFAPTAPINGMVYTMGGIAHRETFVNELNSMYKSDLHRKTYSKRGVRKAAEFPWSRTALEMCAVLDKVLYNAAQTDTDGASAEVPSLTVDDTQQGG